MLSMSTAHKFIIRIGIFKWTNLLRVLMYNHVDTLLNECCGMREIHVFKWMKLSDVYFFKWEMSDVLFVVRDIDFHLWHAWKRKSLIRTMQLI